jgi:hypothetical protein
MRKMTVRLGLALLCLTSATAVAAQSGGWELGPAARIAFSEAGRPIYVLDCTGSELVVTQFGVTQLVDLQKNRPVGDTEGTALPAGAALMALATDRSEPNLVPASAVRNSGPGWDMTIRLPKNDPALSTLPKAKYVSLFTTGFTRAVTLGKADRALLANFVGQCRGKISG